MQRWPNVRVLVSSLLVFAFGFSPLTRPGKAAPQRTDNGQGSIHRDDPCGQLPNPPGNANGIDKLCPAGGSSSGVAKGDFNGDGFADLAVGVPDEDLGGIVNGGSVNIIYGSANGLTATTAGIPPAQFWSLSFLGLNGGSRAGDRFGAALAAGDFNGDGFSDLAIGIPDRSVTTTFLFVNTVHKFAGAVAVIYGSKNGLTATDPTVPKPQYFDLTNTDPTSGFFTLDNAHFGQALAWGNFNNDKVSGRDIADLAIGIPGTGPVDFFFGTNLLPNEGAVFVILGKSGSGLLGGAIHAIEEANVAIDGAPLAGSLFGNALTAADFDGDGFADLAIGAPSRNTGVFSNGSCVQACKSQAGTVFLLKGNASGVNVDNSIQVFKQSDVSGNPENFDHFGISLAAGDFNGDGKADIAIGVPFHDSGTLADSGIVDVLYGLGALGAQVWSLGALGQTNEAGAEFGFALAAGDFNADGRADLAIGVPLRDVSGVIDAGQVNVIYGSGSGLSLARTPQTWSQSTANIGAGTPQQGDHFGQSLTAWNFGHNVETGPSGQITATTADLAIGIPFKDVGTASDAGAVLVIYGSALLNGLTAAGNQLWTQNSPGMPCCSESGDHFGAALY